MIDELLAMLGMVLTAILVCAVTTKIERIENRWIGRLIIFVLVPIFSFTVMDWIHRTTFTSHPELKRIYCGRQNPY